ncbi:hypothetical protein KCM76_19340 [Zooshikella marina]|uniref:lipase secretion chaperone n=1 Tax=Zooshikella ganghwensis TaxID=202772 RepID=UPI001BAE76EE|nr:lipase secretion chaperone [Zooshikella ganghwensis]MBU2708155.1 hypothetical protein [Zooshikella ganghwensis]
MAVNRQRSFLISGLVSFTIVIIAYVVVMFFPVTSETRNQPLTSKTHQYEKTFLASSEPELIQDDAEAKVHQVKAELPEYLLDTSVDGGLPVDSQGQLVVSREIRDLFDYFLSVQGIEPFDQSVNRLKQYIRLQLNSPAVEQALALLEQYLAYKKALVDLESTISDQGDYLGVKAQSTYDVSNLNNRLTVLNELRHEHFSVSDTEAFFGREIRYDRYMLARIMIIQNEELSKEQQKAALRALNASLTEDDRALFLVADPVSKKAEIHAIAASEASTNQALSAEFGNAAVERLSQLEQMRLNWQQRVSHYQQSLNRIMGSSMALEDKGQAIETLLQQSFSENEQLRVKALVTHP